jgi:phosphohistidine phosphatase
MRHGKAEPFGAEDHKRRLTERGARDARAAGEWLALRGYVPTHAFVSSAVRTQATWAALVSGCSSPATPTVAGSLFSADPSTVIDVLRGAPEDAAVVAYVGHNPTAASLAHLLDDGEPDPSAFRALSEGFPAAAMAVLEVPVPWADLDAGSAHLVDFHVGQA